MSDLLPALASSTEADMDRYICFEIPDCMEVFYKVSHLYLQPQSPSNRSIGCYENIYRHRCVLSSRLLSPLRSKLNTVYSPWFVLQLDRQLVYEITSKSQLDYLLRKQTQKRFIVLQTGLDMCNTDVERHHPVINIPSKIS